MYCSREGLPDSQRNPKPSPQRKRPSKRCDCRWRVVLSENEEEKWEFRKSMNPNASEHNHEMMLPEEMVKAWPAQVNDMIIQLARQRLQTHEIREAVKQRFPDITWNERRFYNRLTEERKRIKQRGVVERSQRLLLLTARLCSLAAANEEWTTCVELEIKRQFENFCQLGHLKPESIDTLVDIQMDLIQTDKGIHNLLSDSENLEIDSPSKKRRKSPKASNTSNPEPQKGIQLVHVPSYILQVNSGLISGSSEVKRYPYGEQPFQENNQSFRSSSSFAPLASPTSSSSSSSSVPFQRQQQRMGSSQSSEFIMQPYSQATTGQQYAMANPELEYQLQTSFSPYTIPTNALASPPEVGYSFEQPQMIQKEQKRQGSFDFYQNPVKEEYPTIQRHMSQTGYSLPMIRANENPEEANWT